MVETRMNLCCLEPDKTNWPTLAFIAEVSFARQPEKYELVLTKIFAKDLYSIVTAYGVAIRLATIVLSSKSRGIVEV